MKILYLCSLYHPHIGGIETMVNELSQCAVKKSRANQAMVLTKRFPKSLETVSRRNRVSIFRFIPPRHKTDYRALGQFLKNHEASIKSDVIHVMGLRQPMPLIGSFLAREWNAKLIGTVCGGEVPMPNDPESKKVWVRGAHTVRPFLNNFHTITACSDFLRKQFAACDPKNARRTKVLYAGLQVAKKSHRTQQISSEPYIFVFRRLVHSKGIDVAIRGFARYSKRFPEVTMIIAGSGPEESALKKLVGQLGIKKKVSFIGSVDLQTGMQYLRGAVCTIVPSRSEGGGLVNIEAQSVGCPVIASRAGGIPEYLGHAGLFFTNASELADQLSLIYTNPSIRRKLIRRGRAHAKKFDWKALYPYYWKIYTADGSHSPRRTLRNRNDQLTRELQYGYKS